MSYRNTVHERILCTANKIKTETIHFYKLDEWCKNNKNAIIIDIKISTYLNHGFDYVLIIYMEVNEKRHNINPEIKVTLDKFEADKIFELLRPYLSTILTSN